MKRVGGVAAVAAGVVLLAGCGIAPTTSTDTSTTSTVSATPWASIVSEQERDLEKLITDLEQDCVTPATDIAAVTCTYQLQTARLKGQILRKKFDELEGTPPTEASTLVSDTLKAADSLGAWTISAACTNGVDTVTMYSKWCAGAGSNIRRLGNALLTKYAAWDPYGA